jgi:hypothetical protein
MQKGKRVTPHIQVLPLEFRVAIHLGGLLRSGLRHFPVERIVGWFSKRVRDHQARKLERRMASRLETKLDMEKAISVLESRSCSLDPPSK